VALVLACSPPPDTRATIEGTPPVDVLGTVHCSNSCDAAVGADFDQAVAKLHSFEFEEARGDFGSIAERDPGCAMAHWGVAMTYYHPLWAPPTESDLESGSQAVARAQGLEKTERERLYVSAIASFYEDAGTSTHRNRAKAYEASMRELAAANPDDPEARIFNALAILSNADPTDKTYAVQKLTGSMLEPMFVDMPDHPGLAHYIIHSYDYPPLAERAVDAAYRYLDIAPSLPHALHMTAHIFTQRGMWEDSIHANTRSAQAARDRGKRFGLLEQAQLNEMHALDYLVYAHLQRGENDKAASIVEDIEGRPSLNWNNGVVAFNAGAAPVRYPLELRLWDRAADLEPLLDAAAAGDRYEIRATLALRHWGRAVGAARSGRIEAAENDLADLTRIAAEMRSHPNVWARNTPEVLRLEAASWLALARGDGSSALEHMTAAAELEDQTDKSGLSPGRVLPVHEQLGDLLMQLSRPSEALAAYEESESYAPRRFNTYLGAARAADASGNPQVASDYYAKLLQLAAADSQRAELAEARDFLDGKLGSG